MDYFHSAEFSALVTSLIEINHVPGLSIAITQAKKTASLAFGLASVDDQTPCTDDTLFDIASSAKSLTAGAVALMADDKAFKDVSWEATMSSMLPDDFVGPNDDFTNNVTLEDVVSHRTGMAGSVSFSPISSYSLLTTSSVTTTHTSA